MTNDDENGKITTMPDELRKIHVPPGHSLATANLIKLLRQNNAIGNVLTDEQMTAACGKDTRTKGKGYASLQSAIKYVCRVDGFVWARVQKAMAIKCLNTEELLGVGQSALSQIRKKSKNTGRKMETGDLNKLPTEKRTQYLAVTAQLGTIVQFSGKSTTKALEIRGVNKPMDFSGTIKMFEAPK